MSNEHNLMNTKEKHLGYIVPYIVEDIGNFKVFSRISSRGSLKFKKTNCTISKLIHLMLVESTIIPDTTINRFKQQIIFIEFYDVLRKTVLNTAISNYLEPTFILDYKGYNYNNELCSSEYFTFGYILDRPITEKGLIDSICKHLENVFNSYRCDVNTGCFIDMSDVDISNNFKNIILSHKIYVPAEGGIFNVKR